MTARTVVTVRRDVMAQAHGQAESFRQSLSERGTLIVNVMSSPGSGKTSLLAATADHWGERYRMAVLVGDIATDRDAQRLAEHTPAVQLTTGGACHLEYPLIEQGWQALGEPQLDFLFVENIGNLVCPASHDLGEHLRVLLLSTTEGDDKPAKYPKAFRTSHALVISKSDLLPYVPFDVSRAAADARSIQPDLAIFPLSTRPVTGLVAWCDYLVTQRQRLLAGERCRPNR
jgi:hydrogenase nickel incorporation protein HypB